MELTNAYGDYRKTYLNFKKFKKEFFSEISESWCNDHFPYQTIPKRFYKLEYKKYLEWLRINNTGAWIRYKFNKFREEKTGLKFIQ